MEYTMRLYAPRVCRAWHGYVDAHLAGLNRTFAIARHALLDGQTSTLNGVATPTGILDYFNATLPCPGGASEYIPPFVHGVNSMKVAFAPSSLNEPTTPQPQPGAQARSQYPLPTAR